MLNRFRKNNLKDIIGEMFYAAENKDDPGVERLNRDYVHLASKLYSSDFSDADFHYELCRREILWLSKLSRAEHQEILSSARIKLLNLPNLTSQRQLNQLLLQV